MFYDVFKRLCNEKGVSPSRACIDMNLSRSLGAKWKNTGANPSFEVLSKMSEYFGVTVDYLLGVEAQKETPTLTKKDERDIARNLESIMRQMEQGGDLMFDGNPMSNEARESIMAAMKLGLEAAKLRNKERFTPKKYKGE